MDYHEKDKLWSKVDIKGSDDCWDWKAATNIKGYGRFYTDSKLVSAHRYAWSLINGPIPEGKLILHKCDNPPCCNPAHLYCGTPKDNMRDKGTRHPVPSEVLGSGSTKLHEGEIWLIRKLWREGKNFLSYSFIAKMFKVNPSTISHIVNSTSWLCKEGTYV